MDQYSHAEPVEIPEEALKLTLENEEPAGFGQGLYNRMQKSPFLIAGTCLIDLLDLRIILLTVKSVYFINQTVNLANVLSHIVMNLIIFLLFFIKVKKIS